MEMIIFLCFLLTLNFRGNALEEDVSYQSKQSPEILKEYEELFITHFLDQPRKWELLHNLDHQPTTKRYFKILCEKLWGKPDLPEKEVFCVNRFNPLGRKPADNLFKPSGVVFQELDSPYKIPVDTLQCLCMYKDSTTGAEDADSVEEFFLFEYSEKQYFIFEQIRPYNRRELVITNLVNLEQQAKMKLMKQL